MHPCRGYHRRTASERGSKTEPMPHGVIHALRGKNQEKWGVADQEENEADTFKITEDTLKP